MDAAAQPRPRLPSRLLRDGWWLAGQGDPPASGMVIPFPARRPGAAASASLSKDRTR